MENIVYIRLRHRVQIRPRETVFLKDLAQIIADENIIEKIAQIPIAKPTEKDNNIVVVDVMEVVRKMIKSIPGIEVQTIGPTQTIIEIIYKKKRISIPVFLLIWLLLFFGSALAIMYFHEDVSMRETQERLYTVITGRIEEKPLLFQIPYSIGLGLGMILFFNHIFKKRLNDEPSPLEVEMFNYQMDIDNYVALTENEESMKEIDDD